MRTLKQLYFEWMYRLLCGGPSEKEQTYRKLLTHLHDTEFTYTIPMDGNRAEDGIDLRYRFGRESRYYDYEIAAELDNCPCSVLEMMAALAIRCEEHIMDDPDIGNRTRQWFWSMIESLGLRGMVDSRYEEDYVDFTLQRFLNHEYGCDGSGGLFTILNCPYDLRTVEIWYQMCWYLDEIL